jgi:hypothetical protein
VCVEASESHNEIKGLKVSRAAYGAFVHSTKNAEYPVISGLNHLSAIFGIAASLQKT